MLLDKCNRLQVTSDKGPDDDGDWGHLFVSGSCAGNSLGGTVLFLAHSHKSTPHITTTAGGVVGAGAERALGRLKGVQGERGELTPPLLLVAVFAVNKGGNMTKGSLATTATVDGGLLPRGAATHHHPLAHKYSSSNLNIPRISVSASPGGGEDANNIYHA